MARTRQKRKAKRREEQLKASRRSGAAKERPMNPAEQPEAGTVQTFPLAWSVQCTSTVETTRGSNCSTTTSLNAILPGAVVESKRTIWELGQVTVRDAGPNGTGYAACPSTCGDGDEGTFMRQGIFIP